MQAVIMAGGFGTRLKPLTNNAPKPMIHIANKPMMEHVVKGLSLVPKPPAIITACILCSPIVLNLKYDFKF